MFKSSTEYRKKLKESLLPENEFIMAEAGIFNITQVLQNVIPACDRGIKKGYIADYLIEKPESFTKATTHVVIGIKGESLDNMLPTLVDLVYFQQLSMNVDKTYTLRLFVFTKKEPHKIIMLTGFKKKTPQRPINLCTEVIKYSKEMDLWLNSKGIKFDIKNLWDTYRDLVYELKN